MEHAADITAAHADAERRGLPMYQDPETGLWVMTARSLRERGYCCQSGCRHCPYGYAGRPDAGA